MPERPVDPNAATVAAPATVLVVGTTGSIGRLVVAEALWQGYAVRALVRDAAKARRALPAEAQLVQREVTRPDGLGMVVEGADAIVFTLGRLRRRAQRAAGPRSPQAT